MANDREVTSYGSTYFVDIPYYLGLISLKEHNKMNAILYYIELKNIYTYNADDNAKKLNLFKRNQKIGRRYNDTYI